MTEAPEPISTTAISRAAGLTSRAGRCLFEQLLFRRADPTISTREVEPEKQVCWLVPGTRNYRTLVVPTMMGWWEDNGVYAVRTIVALERRDLIAQSELQSDPHGPHLPLTYPRKELTMVAFVPTEELTASSDLKVQFDAVAGTLEIVETDLRIKPKHDRITVMLDLPHLKRYGHQTTRELTYGCSFPVQVGDVVRCPPTPLYGHWTTGVVTALEANGYRGRVKYVRKIKESS